MNCSLFLSNHCSFLFLLMRRYKYCQRFNLLPGLKTNFGILGNCKAIFAQMKRVQNNSLATTEMYEAIHMFSCGEKETKSFFTFWIEPAPFVQLSSPQYIRELHNNGDLPKAFSYAIPSCLALEVSI